VGECRDLIKKGMSGLKERMSFRIGLKARGGTCCSLAPLRTPSITSAVWDGHSCPTPLTLILILTLVLIDSDREGHGFSPATKRHKINPASAAEGTRYAKGCHSESGGRPGEEPAVRSRHSELRRSHQPVWGRTLLSVALDPDLDFDLDAATAAPSQKRCRTHHPHSSPVGTARL
jgi:hypothetical protein